MSRPPGSYLVPAVPDDYVIPDHLLAIATKGAEAALSDPTWKAPNNLTALAERRGITIEEAARLVAAHTIERYTTKEGT